MSDKSNYVIHPPTLRELGICSQPPNHPFCLLGFSQNTSDFPPPCSNLLHTDSEVKQYCMFDEVMKAGKKRCVDGK